MVDYGRKKRPDLLDDDGWSRVEGQLAGSAAAAESRIEIASLAWERLTATELECLRLRSEGLKFREIGEVLGLTISTVASYVARAIKKLQHAPEPQARALKKG
jgi:RNA polymerase sigma factor (sigma-70 family)